MIVCAIALSIVALSFVSHHVLSSSPAPCCLVPVWVWVSLSTCVHCPVLFTFLFLKVALGSKFRMTCRSTARHRSSDALVFVGHVSEQEVEWSVRALMGLCLQSIGGLLLDRNCCCLSTAFDGAMHNGESHTIREIWNHIYPFTFHEENIYWPFKEK